MIKNEHKNKQIQDGFFCCVLLIVACFLFWKCKFGIGNIDESFYLTIPYRLYQGDSLFLEEWHLSQMSGVLTWPIVAVFLSLNQGTDGIILAMRYICTGGQCIIAFFLYYRLRKINWIGAVCATISFVLYIPFGIMAFSYNSMGIMLLVLTGMFLLSGNKTKEISYVAAGLCFAAAVLCCPYLVLIYGIYILVIIIKKICFRKNEKNVERSVFTIKSGIFFSLGAAIAAVIFGIFVLSRASLGEIIKAFPQIMNDPEHSSSLSISYKVKSFWEVIVNATSVSKYLYFALTLLLGGCILDKKRKLHREIYFLFVGICVLISMWSHYRQINYINHIMWSINLMGPFIFLLSNEKINRLFWQIFWVPGMLYTFCLHLSSNQKFYAISSASSVATVGSIMMLVVFVYELIKVQNQQFWKLFLKVGCGVLLFVQLFCQADLRYKSVFWESGMESQTELVEEGIQAGLYVSEVRKEEYNSALENLKQVKEYGGEKVLFLSKNTWYYLVDNYEMATYSAWLSGVNERTILRLEAYYMLNEDKIPDVVYADLNDVEMVEYFADKFGYKVSQITGGWVMIK